jgi:hypothetical protein
LINEIRIKNEAERMKLEFVPILIRPSPAWSSQPDPWSPCFNPNPEISPKMKLSFIYSFLYFFGMRDSNHARFLVFQCIYYLLFIHFVLLYYSSRVAIT